MGNTLYLGLTGELDEHASDYTRGTLDDIIDRHRMLKVIMDLSNLSFMDSTGVGVLIGRYKRLKNRNTVVFVKNPSPTIDKIFQMSGLYEIMPRVV